MPPERGRRALLSAAWCAILLSLVGSLYLIRPRAPLDKVHRRLIIADHFCGCSDDVAIYVKAGAPCPAGPQGKVESCPRASSFYQKFVPRTVAASTTAVPDSVETANTGITSIMVPGLSQGCSGTATSCLTSYSFSWVGGAGASINVTDGTASTIKLPSVTASSTGSGSTSTSLTPSVISSSVSTATSTSTQTSMHSSMEASASASMQHSCPTFSGILSSWTTTGTFMEDYAVVIRTDIAGFNGVSTAPICNLGTVTWMPAPTTSMPLDNASTSTSQIASGAGSDVWTTTITAQQGVKTVILALENTRASNGDTKILSTLSSSTVSPPSLTTSSSSLPAAPVPVPSSAAKTTGYTNSSTAQTIPVSVSHTPGATWTTTMTLTQGSVTVVLFDLVSEVSAGSLIVTLISASTLESAVVTSSSATVSQIFPLPANTSLSSESTGMPLPPSSAQLTTVTIASPSPPFASSSVAATTSSVVTSDVNSTMGSLTIGNTPTTSVSLMATTGANSSQAQGPIPGSVSINTAWTPAGSIFSTQYTYTITDGTFGGEVVVGKSSWLAVSINAHSTRTDFLGKNVISILPFTGTAPFGSITQVSVSASTTVAFPLPSVTASSITSISSTNVSVVPTAAVGGTFSAASSQLSSIASIKNVILSSSTRTRTTRVKSTMQSSSSITAKILPRTTSALKSSTYHSPTTRHADHTSQAGDEHHFSAREAQGTTICAQSNCLDTSFPPFSGTTTATIPETEQGPFSTVAPYVPDSAAERVYRGVRWCLPWMGCVTFEMVLGLLVAAVMTLVMFWEW